MQGVGHHAGVDEDGAFDVGHLAVVDEGALPLDAARGQVAASEDLAVFGAGADAAVAVAAYRGVAPGDEHQGGRYAGGVPGDYRTAFGAQGQAATAGDAVVVLHQVQRQEAQPACIGAQEGQALAGQRDAGADFHGQAHAAGGQDVAVEVTAGPAPVEADRRGRGRGVGALVVGIVELQHVAAVDAVVALLDAAHAQAAALHVVAAGGFFQQVAAHHAAPAALVGQRHPFAAQGDGLVVVGELGYGPPVGGRHLVVGVVHADAGAAVGADAHPEDHALEGSLADLGDDGGVLRVGCLGVDGQEGRIEVAAAGQPLLGLQQPCCVVVGSHRHAGEQADCIIAVAAAALVLHLYRAEAEGRPRVVGDLEPGIGRIGVHVGQAGADGGGGEAEGGQCAQAAGLGVVPGVLGEILTRPQPPHRLDAGPLGLGGHVIADAACEVDGHIADDGARAWLHLDGDGPLGLRIVRGVAHLQPQSWRKIAHGSQQFACVGVGSAQQARELGAREVVQLAEALDLQVAVEVLGQFLGGLYVERERIPRGGGLVVGCAALQHFGAAHGSCIGAVGFGFLARQQAAPLQEQGADQKKSRQKSRLADEKGPVHVSILTAAAWPPPIP